MKPYQYVVLRCVPRVEREEFVNVGVVLYCQERDFLDVGWHVDRDRLSALAPGVDIDSVCDAMDFIDAVCRARRGRRLGGDQGPRHPLRLPQGARGAPSYSQDPCTAA